MFTGIIEEVGKIRQLRLPGQTGEVRVEARKILEGLKPGDSISVNGACLTVRSVAAGGFHAEISQETLSRTSFARSREGDSVNLERPLLPTSRLGGHIVQGHVDGIGKLERVRSEGGFAVYSFSMPKSIQPYVVEKGSIAVDGVSLTVTKLGSGQFEVALIPHTLENTNLAARRVGDWVNLECDILAKYVESLLKARAATEKTPLTVEYMREQGY